MDYLVSTLVMGVGATVLTDLWALARRHLFGAPLPDFRLVGRWVAHMGGGTFRHARIEAARSVRGEHGIGWTIHYVVGIAFAALLPGLFGTAWFGTPTLGPAVLIGVGSVAAPFFVMQPGMGYGIAASRTPRPGVARMRTVITHLVFGLGLYAAAILIHHVHGA